MSDFSCSPLLKNALDWISRSHTEDEPSLWTNNGMVATLGLVVLGKPLLTI